MATPSMTERRTPLDGTASLFVHTTGDDFDGCGNCYDDQHLAGVRVPRPCVHPEPGTDGFNDLEAGTPRVPCLNCGHDVSLSRNLL